MEYTQGQAVISKNNDLLYFISAIEKGGSFYYIYLSVLNGSKLPIPCYNNEICPATEAEILGHIQQHGWKQSNSKWLYTSPSGQLELMDNEGWQPVIKRQPLPDQFEFFGNECIQADRIIKALKLAK